MWTLITLGQHSNSSVIWLITLYRGKNLLANRIASRTFVTLCNKHVIFLIENIHKNTWSYLPIINRCTSHYPSNLVPLFVGVIDSYRFSIHRKLLNFITIMVDDRFWKKLRLIEYSSCCNLYRYHLKFPI